MRTGGENEPSTSKKGIQQRFYSRRIGILPCKHRLKTNLIAKGFLDEATLQGKSQRKLLPLTPYEIIKLYEMTALGLTNYYCYVDNSKRLYFAIYILRYSCLHTLASHHRISLPKAIAKYNINPHIEQPLKINKEKSIIREANLFPWKYYKDRIVGRKAFLSNKYKVKI